MKKRKFNKEKHDLIRLLRNTQRKNENNIRLEQKRISDSLNTKYVQEYETTTENA